MLSVCNRLKNHKVYVIIAQSKDEKMHVLRFAFDNYLSNASKLIEHAFVPINTQPDTIDFFRQRTSCDNQSTYFTATFRKQFLFLNPVPWFAYSTNTYTS